MIGQAGLDGGQLVLCEQRRRRAWPTGEDDHRRLRRVLGVDLLDEQLGGAWHLAAAVDKEDPGNRQAAPGVQDLPTLFADDRVREPVAAHVPFRVRAEVVRVDADEGDAVPVFARILLEPLRLVGARVAPGGEEVQHAWLVDRGELDRSVTVESRKREVGRGRPLPLRELGRNAPAGVVRQLPDEQREKARNAQKRKCLQGKADRSHFVTQKR